MRFLVDAQFPPALARFLAGLGHTAEHVSDISLNGADDSATWNYAWENGAIIITKDEDFSHRLSQSQASPFIVWLRIGNTSRRGLLVWFETVLPQILRHIQVGDRLIEVT